MEPTPEDAQSNQHTGQTIFVDPNHLHQDQAPEQSATPNDTMQSEGKQIKINSTCIIVFLTTCTVVSLALFVLDVRYGGQAPKAVNHLKHEMVPEDNYLSDQDPSNNIWLVDNIRLNVETDYVVIIPQYIDQHTVCLKIINFYNQPRVSLEINGVMLMLDVQSDYETRNLTFHQFIFKKRPHSKHTHIPQTIVQTYETRMVTRMKYLSVRSIIDWNPEFRYEFFDAQRRIDFIRQHFEAAVLDAYLHLVPGTYKADFFRFCYLYIYGGIYMDCKLVCTENYNNVASQKQDMEFAQDQVGETYYQTAFIASVPKIQPLKDLIDLLVRHIQTKYYGRNSLDPTGPGAMYTALHSYVYSHPEKYKIIAFQRVKSEVDYGFEYLDFQFGRLAYFHYPSYYAENNYGNKNYNAYYRNRTIYYP